MAGKTCTKCGVWKPYEEFPIHRQAVDGRNSWCKECCRKKENDKYKTSAEHREKVRKQVRHRYERDKGKILKADARRREERKRHLIRLRGGDCEECGLPLSDKWPVDCFDFHHSNGEKEAMIGWLISRTARRTDRLIAEVEKCRVLCANCHRKLHYEERRSRDES